MNERTKSIDNPQRSNKSAKKQNKNEMKRNEYGLFFVVFLIQKTTKENTTEHAQREREKILQNVKKTNEKKKKRIFIIL